LEDDNGRVPGREPPKKQCGHSKEKALVLEQMLFSLEWRQQACCILCGLSWRKQLAGVAEQVRVWSPNNLM